MGVDVAAEAIPELVELIDALWAADVEVTKDVVVEDESVVELVDNTLVGGAG